MITDDADLIFIAGKLKRITKSVVSVRVPEYNGGVSRTTSQVRLVEV